MVIIGCLIVLKFFQERVNVFLDVIISLPSMACLGQSKFQSVLVYVLLKEDVVEIFKVSICI